MLTCDFAGALIVFSLMVMLIAVFPFVPYKDDSALFW